MRRFVQTLHRPPLTMARAVLACLAAKRPAPARDKLLACAGIGERGK